MMKTIKVKLNVDMLHYKKGSILTLTSKKHSGDGIFLCPYFKRRIKDSEIDNCLEIIGANITSNFSIGSGITKSGITKENNIEDNIIEKPVSKKRGRPKTKKD